MSISRKNWSALSSLARQWTVEDEEEVEREKRRRVRGFSSTSDPNDDPSADPGAPAIRNAAGGDLGIDRSQGLSNAEQLQLDFVEILRVRDEKRRSRHVETLRRQRGGEEEEEEGGKGRTGGGGARLELLGDMEGDEEDTGGEEAAAPGPPRPAHSPGVTPLSPRSITTASAITTTSAITNTHTQSQRSENVHLPESTEPKPSSAPGRKFVSSVSISFDKSSTSSERSGPTSPMSPRSPVAPLSPREPWSSPCQSPLPRGAQSPTQNGDSPGSVNGAPSSGTVNVEQTARPAFAKQSSRTASFRMLRKKEEERLPQRSASVRMANKNFEPTDQNQEDDKASHFQRNSKQRVSSRTIQEKMERLAQAAQKSEMMRSPDVAQRTLFLLDEVSRKRGLFEKEQGAADVPRKENRGFTAGLSDRINRLVGKTSHLGSSHSPTDLRHVDITSKRTLFESRAEEGSAKAAPPGKVYK
ncbi:ladinin-1 [Aplochiton taeniatus]